MLEDYNIVHFTIRQFQNSEICTIRKSGTGTSVSASSVFIHIHITCLTCTQQLMTKAGVKSEML